MSVRTKALRAALAASTILLATLGGCRPGGEIPTGDLTSVGIYTDATIDGAYALAVSPDGKHLYVTATTARAVAWFTRDSATGALAYAGRYSDVTIDTPRCLAVSPDGEHVYVGASAVGGSDGTVAWFDRNPATGALTYAGKDTRTEIDGIYSIAIPSTGAHLYVAAQDTATVAWYTLDTVTGDASYGGRYNDVATLATSQSVALSPDGLHAYVAAGGYDTVAWFSRDSVGGALTFLGNYSDPGIDSARNVAVSPDGSSVYVTGWLADSVAWFRRD